MVPLITFTSTRFDWRNETPNPINPIAGQGPLLWLVEALAPAVAMSAPAPEDWGWYSDVRCEGQGYLLGCAFVGDSEHDEWMLQLHKQRSLVDKLLGRGRMTAEDPLLLRLLEVLRAQPDMCDVVVESGR